MPSGRGEFHMKEGDIVRIGIKIPGNNENSYLIAHNIDYVNFFLVKTWTRRALRAESLRWAVGRQADRQRFPRHLRGQPGAVRDHVRDSAADITTSRTRRARPRRCGADCWGGWRSTIASSNSVVCWLTHVQATRPARQGTAGRRIVTGRRRRDRGAGPLGAAPEHRRLLCPRPRT